MADQNDVPNNNAEFGGLPVKILWSVLGVTPAVLFVTGLVVWWRPKNRKRRREASTALQPGERSHSSETMLAARSMRG